MDILHSYLLSCLHYKSFLKPLQRFASITLNYVWRGVRVHLGAWTWLQVSGESWSLGLPGAGVTELEHSWKGAGNSGPPGAAALNSSPFEKHFQKSWLRRAEFPNAYKCWVQGKEDENLALSPNQVTMKSPRTTSQGVGVNTCCIRTPWIQRMVIGHQWIETVPICSYWWVQMILRNRTKMSLITLEGCETTLDVDK